MESTPALATLSPELILRTGRYQGARRPLKSPITFVGSEPGCDIQLNVEGVEPVHCVIGTGADGPVLRAWNTAEVFVNGSAIQACSLHHGDVVQIGPFEFEVRHPIPLALPLEERPGASPCEPISFRDLRKQLIKARVAFRHEKRQERQQIARERLQLAEVRDAIDKKQAAIQHERDRLVLLRERFVQHWKKRWTTERKRVDRDSDRIQIDRAALEISKRDFSKETEEFRVQRDAEERRFERAWRHLRNAEKNIAEEQARQRASLESQQSRLEERERILQSEQRALQADRELVEQRIAQLRLEAEGLETRIANLRDVLVQLEAKRPLPVRDVASSPEIIVPKDPRETEQLGDLDRLVSEVDDQRRVLLEQANRLTTAREALRVEENRIASEMEQLGEQLRSWEEHLVNRDRETAREEASLENERTNLQHLRDRLDAWQARLEARNLELSGEVSRLESDLQQRMRQNERREMVLADLYRRWSDRRLAEIEQLRTEHRRCTKQRMAWRRQQSRTERFERHLLQRQRDLAEESLVLEQTRLRFLAATDDPAVVTKQLERLKHRYHRVNGKRDALINNRWEMLHVERKELARLIAQTGKRIEQSAALEREIADRLASTERREQNLLERETSLVEAESTWKVQRESFHRECGGLRDEIERLAGLLLEARAEEAAPLVRAA